MNQHHRHGPSKLGLRYLCPGSYAQEKEAERQGLDLAEREDEAKMGTWYHALLNPATTIPDGHPEPWLIEKARSYIESKMGDCYPHEVASSKIEYEKTMALWAKGDNPTRILTYGTSDAIRVLSAMVEVGEMKFSYVPSPEVSLIWQVRGYLAMAMFEHQKPYGKAWVYNPRLDMEYTGELKDWQSARDVIEEVIQRAEDHPEELHPSPDACRFCRGKAVCPAFSGEISSLPAKKEAMELEPARLAALLEKCATVESLAKAVRAKAREILDAGGVVPGWELGERKVREVVDLDAAFSAVRTVLNQPDFLALCKVPVGKLEDAFAAKWAESRNETKANGVRLFKAVTEGAIEAVPEKFLRRTKGDAE